MQVEAGSSAASADELLKTELQQNDKLEVGYLENGLRYVLLPNRAPPNRFEAHLEVHAGEWRSGERESAFAVWQAVGRQEGREGTLWQREARAAAVYQPWV